MNVARAREILGRQAKSKSDREIAGYVEALGKIADIAVRQAVKQFSLNRDWDLLITRKDGYYITGAHRDRYFSGRTVSKSDLIEFPVRPLEQLTI